MELLEAAAIQAKVRKAETTSKSSGTSIVIPNGVDALVSDIRLYGNAKQNKSTGKNHLRPFITETTVIHGITFKPMLDGGIHVYGTCGVNNGVSISLPSDAFGFVMNTKYLFGYIVNNGGSTNFKIIKPGAFGSPFINVKRPTVIITVGSNPGSSTCMYLQSFMGEKLDFYFYPYMSSNLDFTGFEVYSEKKIAPSTEYKAPIRCIGESGNETLTLKSSKNLLKPFITSTITTVAGVTLEPMEDGGIHVYGDVNASNGQAPLGTTISISLPTCDFSFLKGGVRYSTGYVVANPKSDGFSIIRSGNTTIDFGSKRKQYYERTMGEVAGASNIQIMTSEYNHLDFLFYPYMAEEETFSGFEQYVEDIEITLPLTNPLYSLGDVRDELSLRDGYIQRLVMLEFDGSDDEGWVASDSVEMQYLTTNMYDIKSASACLCDTYVGSDESSTTSGECFVSSTKELGINTAYATLDEFKAALAASPIKVLCELAVPVVTELTEEQRTALQSLQISSHKTTITVSEGIMEVEYLKNTNSGKLLNELSDKIGDVSKLTTIKTTTLHEDISDLGINGTYTKAIVFDATNLLRVQAELKCSITGGGVSAFYGAEGSGGNGTLFYNSNGVAGTITAHIDIDVSELTGMCEIYLSGGAGSLDVSVTNIVALETIPCDNLVDAILGVVLSS